MKLLGLNYINWLYVAQPDLFYNVSLSFHISILMNKKLLK